MSTVLKIDGTWSEDGTRIVRDAAQVPQAGDVVPLATYLALAPAQRTGLGVWLAPEDDAAKLAEFTGALTLIGVDFPAFKDGRGFSTAALLRTRYGFRGDLRAIGDVVVDLVFYMKRVGFSSFALRADQDAALASAALGTFTDVYQASVDQPQPFFRRRAPAGAVL